MILSLLLEEEEIYFTKEELELFEEHFLPYGWGSGEVGGCTLTHVCRCICIDRPTPEFSPTTPPPRFK